MPQTAHHSTSILPESGKPTTWNSVCNRLRADMVTDGFPNPSAYAWDAAHTLWKYLSSLFSGDLDVYSTEEGEIIIDATATSQKSWVILEIGPAESVLCVVSMNSVFRHDTLHGTDYQDHTFIRNATLELQAQETGP